MTVTTNDRQSPTRRMRRVLAAVAAFVAALAGVDARCAGVREAQVPPAPFESIAFFYGDAVPVERLGAFDAVVVEPDAAFDPRAPASAGHRWFAYVSVGEVGPGRAYYRSIPKRWLVGRNGAWGSAVVDQGAPGWAAFFVQRVVAPLWQRGYRGFFLDTLDSYQLIAKDDRERARQRAGIVAVVLAIKARYPQARLIFNRGFELLPFVHEAVSAVAFESLFGSWNQGTRNYGEVPSGDRDWLLTQARTVQTHYGLPVISIDYCPPENPVRCREIAQRISDEGLVAYVADGALATVGVGAASGPRD